MNKKNWKSQKNLLKSLHSQLTNQANICHLTNFRDLLVIFIFLFSILSSKSLNCKGSSSTRIFKDRSHILLFLYLKSSWYIFNWSSYTWDETSDPSITLRISCIISSLQKRLLWPNLLFFSLFRSSLRHTTQNVWFHIKENKWVQINCKVINQSWF